jgi:hypothetical protein
VNLTEIVVAMVQEAGKATVDDLMPDLPGYTRRQVQACLRNSAYNNLLVCLSRGEHKGGGTSFRGRLPGVFAPVPEPSNVECPRPANSVWEWGTRA